jgi:ribosome-associated toxin RatA of RatAB toxin-antitoxin module
LVSKVKKQALVPYSCEQMFDLVNDVKAYPEFIPWCSHVDVISASEAQLVATICFSAGLVKQSFTTCNQLEYPHKMAISLQEGPFKSLSGEWRFEPIDGQCNVSLHLSFAFANRLLEGTMGTVFYRATQAMMGYFVARADEVLTCEG